MDNRLTLSDRLYPSRFSRFHWCLTGMRRELTQAVEQYVAGQSCRLVVDYGCGDMPYQPLFAEHTVDYLGCDLPSNQLAKIHLLPDGSLPLGAGTVDVVLSTQVLEHVPEPGRYLTEAWRVLREDGRLLLTTHGVWPYHPYPQDYWRWTREGLRKLVEDSGFKVQTLRGVLGPAATAVQLLQESWLPRLPRFLRNAFVGAAQVMICVADQLSTQAFRDNDACVFVVAATKQPRPAA